VQIVTGISVRHRDIDSQWADHMGHTVQRNYGDLADSRVPTRETDG